MLVELLNRLLNLAAPTQLDVDGRIYFSRSMEEVKEPEAATLNVKTLTGFIDAAKTEIDDISADYLVQVAEHNRVLLMPSDRDQWGRRDEYIIATADDCRFQFGSWLDPEQFIIGLQTCFVQTQAGDDLPKVLKLASNLAAEAVNISQDDGVSQQVATRQGVVMKDTEVVKPRVVLRPFRTFREIAQPPSDFVLRFRSRNGDRPLCALFEADGGEWRQVAMQAVKDYLTLHLKDVVIVA